MANFISKSLSRPQDGPDTQDEHQSQLHIHGSQPLESKFFQSNSALLLCDKGAASPKHAHKILTCFLFNPRITTESLKWHEVRCLWILMYSANRRLAGHSVLAMPLVCGGLLLTDLGLFIPRAELLPSFEPPLNPPPFCATLGAVGKGQYWQK
jgi:hypothetical protein